MGEDKKSANEDAAGNLALDYEALTVVEQLVIETLAARVRLGEHMWTFTRRVQRQLRHLERLGWIGWKHGIVQWTCLVWFTDAGRSTALDDSYTSPAHCNKGCAWCDGTSECRYVCVCGLCLQGFPVFPARSSVAEQVAP